MKHRKGTSADYSGSNGVLTPKSTVDPEKQLGKRCYKEEEDEIFGHNNCRARE